MMLFCLNTISIVLLAPPVIPLTELEQIVFFKPDLAPLNSARRIRDQAHDRERVYALAAAALPHHTKDLALLNGVGDAVDRMDGAVTSVETSG